jgi:5'-nucleotidase
VPFQLFDLPCRGSEMRMIDQAHLPNQPVRPTGPKQALGYLIDMDGVIYRGGLLIPGADRFIHRLREERIPFRFLTNNSQRTRLDVATRLRRLGIDVDEEHVYTCSEATARFLAEKKPRGTAYVIGEGGLLTALHSNGYSVVDKDPDYVVVGEGRTISFEMVEAALGMIMNGAKLVATNFDPNCPTESGLRPGCGALVAMLEVASGVKAFSVGKPSPVMLRGARKELGLSTDQTIVIGDTMETDILGGVQLGYRTILVLSGGTRRDDLKRYAYQPDKVVDSIADLDHADLLRESLGADAPAPARFRGNGPLRERSTSTA